MKRTPIKRKSRSPLAKQKQELWELCKQITRAKHRKEDGTFSCFTCSSHIDTDAKAQTGHGIPSSVCGVYLRYDLRILRIQDYRCNINLGGNGAEFYRRLVQELGQEEVDRIWEDRKKIVKESTFIPQKLEEYRELLKQMT